MYKRLVVLAATVVLGGLAVFAQQPPSAPRSIGSKQRMDDVPTPGRLGGLRTEARPRLDLDATGVSVSLPDVWEVDPATGAQYRRGEVLVRFRPGANVALQARALQSVRGRRVVRSLGDWALVQLDPATPSSDAIRVLRTSAAVADVSLNFRLRTQQFRPNDEFHHLQWNFDAISLPVAWEINPGARNDVTVAVVDTGLNT